MRSLGIETPEHHSLHYNSCIGLLGVILRYLAVRQTLYTSIVQIIIYWYSSREPI
jgi:hypothetical protein